MTRALIVALLLVSPFSFADKFCVPTLLVKTKPESKQQVVKLNDKVNLHLTQVVSMQSVLGARIATNAMCQFLEGANYAGTAQEWKQYIDNAVNGLSKSGYKDIELTLVSDEEKLLKSDLANIQYSLFADAKGNKQVIYNAAILDKEKNYLYSLSVSGNETIKNAVYAEFKRALASMEF